MVLAGADLGVGEVGCGFFGVVDLYWFWCIGKVAIAELSVSVESPGV